MSDKYHLFPRDPFLQNMAINTSAHEREEIPLGAAPFQLLGAININGVVLMHSGGNQCLNWIKKSNSREYAKKNNQYSPVNPPPLHKHRCSGGPHQSVLPGLSSNTGMSITRPLRPVIGYSSHMGVDWRGPPSSGAGAEYLTVLYWLFYILAYSLLLS